MRPDDQAGLLVAAIRQLKERPERRLIAIAGPPAAGKSTLAENLQARLQADGIPCGLVPMDGFHLDNRELSAKGLLPRKGAPETFDFDALRAVLMKLKTQDSVAFPLFDRAKDCVLPDASQVRAEHRHVIVEGNYLLLDVPPWRDLKEFWSYAAFIDVPIAELSKRLVERWTRHGHSVEEAKTRAEANDLPNARLVLEHTIAEETDLVLKHMM